MEIMRGMKYCRDQVKRKKILSKEKMKEKYKIKFEGGQVLRIKKIKLK